MTAQGFCKLTATTQAWMDREPAVISWETFGRDFANFTYDDEIEISNPPAGVGQVARQRMEWLRNELAEQADGSRTPEAEYEARTAPQKALMFAAIAALDATEDEKTDLRFYGDWDLNAVTPENAPALAAETLAHLRAEVVEG